MGQFPSPPASGPARVVWFIGLLVTVAGGALFVIGVVSFMADIARALAAEQPAAPEMGSFIRAVAVGFPLVFAGSVVAWLASVIGPSRPQPSQGGSGPTYNFQNPQGSFTWSGRDTIIYGGQQVNINDTRQQIQLLQSATATLELPPRDRLAARESLASARMELNSDNPDLETVADRLEQYTKILERSDALYRAGENVIGPLRRLGGLLGPLLGKGILTLLAAL